MKEADAQATEKHGRAEAAVLREKGTAEAEALQLKLNAEAAGLSEKASAMQALDEAGRGHEEYRIRLEKDKEVQLEAIRAQQEIAEAQARVLGEGLKSANIDIVGGESMFIDKLVGAMATGKSVDGFFDKSDTGREILGEYLEGKRSLPEDLKEILSKPSLSAGDLQSLSVAAVLTRLAARSDGEGREKLQALLQQAKELGVDDVRLH